MKPSAIFLLDEENWHTVYGPEERSRLSSLLHQPLRFFTRESIRQAGDALFDADIIFSGWGMPVCDREFLDAAPNLKAIFYAAGSTNPFATEALWEREIIVSTANPALAITVAEFVLAQILLSQKRTWQLMREARESRICRRRIGPGNYFSTIGLISLGTIARHLLKLLGSFCFNVVAYDPFVSHEEAHRLGVEKVSLDELFQVSDVVSLHTPLLPETIGMIKEHHFELMKHGATFINTARGAIVDEAGMIAALRVRNDLCAVLDVTESEPPAQSSALYELPNVFLTPHIAGALGAECRRLGAMAVDEYERYLNGDPLQGLVTGSSFASHV
ncbi:glycerate dehydrogenase [Spartobacteria bacterium LR76]|nr:glycerate dehydrogenase [Spartobacteria bacterium LR76]